MRSLVLDGQGVDGQGVHRALDAMESKGRGTLGLLSSPAFSTDGTTSLKLAGIQLCSLRDDRVFLEKPLRKGDQ